MPITPGQHVDPIFLGIGIAICLVVTALFFKHEIELRTKKKRDVASQAHCNLESISRIIIRDMQLCWDEDDLQQYLGRIRQFEINHYGSLNLDYYVKKLKTAFDNQRTEIYRQELIAMNMLEEMNLRVS